MWNLHLILVRPKSRIRISSSPFRNVGVHFSSRDPQYFSTFDPLAAIGESQKSGEDERDSKDGVEEDRDLSLII